MKYKFKQIRKGFAVQRGYVFTLVMVLMLLGSIILAPLLSYMGTGLKTGQVFEQKTDRLYAADAGIDDGKWQIKYNHLEKTCPTYTPYDFNSSWNYSLPEQVNEQNVEVTVRNVWIPSGNPENPSDPLNSPPDPALASRIITGSCGNPPKVIITSSITSQYIDSAHPGTIEIKVQYYPDAGEHLQISELGIWLPPGFAYRNDLGSNIDAYDSTHAPDIFDHEGGSAILWVFNDWPYTGDTGSGKNPFPDVNPSGTSPLVSKITFNFNAPETGMDPETVAWIDTNLDLTGDLGGNVTYTWDGDVHIYHLTSVAGNTQAESYLAKNELRAMGGAVSGDYYATGNSNLSDNDHDKCREHWNDPSTAAVTSGNIPQDAQVSKAYLYWSGWENDDRLTTLFSDNCQGFTSWTAGNTWNINFGNFRSHYSNGSENDRYLALKNSLNLSPYTPGTVVVSWDQWVNGTPGAGDGLDVSFSADQGISWSSNIPVFRGNIGSSPVSYQYTVPAQYMTGNFEFRFYLVGFAGTGQYCNIDNIQVNEMPADTGVVFQIDNGSGFKQVYYDSNGQPQDGTQQLTATRCQVVRNFAGTDPHGFSYSSFCDVTALVNKYSTKAPDPATNYPGWATYSVGGIYADTTAAGGYTRDEWAYANWSLIIIYTSAQTQGHQLYLYDKLVYSNQDTTHGVNVDFDGDGQPGGTIKGFIVPQPVPGEVNAAKMTCFVGEGDLWYSGDYVAMNGVKLWDGINCLDNSKTNPDNVFNSTSLGINTYDGIDVDTLGIDPPNGQYITWSSGILKPGDTSAHIDMVTHTDVWNLVYMIVSFRSETTTGNTLAYLIK